MNRKWVTEAAGLPPGNNRWRSIWRCASPELRRKVSEILKRELNNAFKRAYSGRLEDLVPQESPLFRGIPHV